VPDPGIPLGGGPISYVPQCLAGPHAFISSLERAKSIAKLDGGYGWICPSLYPPLHRTHSISTADSQPAPNNASPCLACPTRSVAVQSRHKHW